MTENELIDALEAWRKSRDLSKTAIAKLLGLKSMQTYKNWLSRKSIPKNHLGPVMSIVKSLDIAEAQKSVRASKLYDPEEMHRLMSAGRLVQVDRSHGGERQKNSSHADPGRSSAPDLAAILKELEPDQRLSGLIEFIETLPESERLRLLASVASGLQGDV